jgi:predicted molibdopterin-dependent oxidoreductase YjgC
LEQTLRLLRRHDGETVGVLVAPQGTNEDSYLLARLAAEVFATPHVVLYPGAPGDEDDLLIRADKNPNTRGAQDMGLPAPGASTALTAMAQAIEQGAIKILYVIDVDLVAAFGADTVARLASHLDGIIVQAANMRPGYERAQVLLPSTTYAERDGTFTNFQGRIQRLNRAITPRGTARPAWQIYTQIATGLGHAWTYASAEAVLADIAESRPGYAGLGYAKIGDLGCLVTQER